MKFNKKNVSYILLILISAAITTCTFMTIFSLNKNRGNSNIKYEEKNDDYKYLVKEIKGKIHVFKNGCKNPLYILNKEVEYLPEYDQNMLKNGIYIYSIEDLNKILEDYGD